MTKNKIENGSAFKAVEAFVEGKPQSVILNIPQLEKLARLELGLAVMLEDIQNFNDEIGMIITSLKKHYNRPRPFQFAYYSEQDLSPFETVTGNSPSYPSGHACQGWFTCLFLAKKFPEKEKELITLAKMIENSRIILGVHYPSDNAFGKKIAETIVNIPNFENLLNV